MELIGSRNSPGRKNSQFLGQGNHFLAFVRSSRAPRNPLPAPVRPLIDSAIASRVAVTAAIAYEIDRALANLKNVLDRLFVQFTAEHPAFAAAYASARKIVNAGNTHAAPAISPPVA